MEIVLDLAATATPGPNGHTNGVARQGRKAPQEEDLASIDTFLRVYGGLMCFGPTLGRLSHGKPVDPHHRCAPARSVLGVNPRPPAKPLGLLAERNRHGDRMSQNPGRAWPFRLHLSVDVTQEDSWIRATSGERFYVFVAAEAAASNPA